MKKVYISSTYKDLIEYRKAVSEALRKIRYDVVCMEDYVARDDRALAACEADVEDCDIYVGIFAWRYGHIPNDDDNKALRSITELEYRKASGRKTCLVFLLSDEAPWPSTLRDAETDEEDRGERIRRLRAELKERCAGYFSTPAELAKEVMAAVYQHESTRRVQRLDVLEEVNKSIELGLSYLPNIQNKIMVMEAQHAEIVEISLGPTPWWTTRLHLVAALASDFTSIRQFVFLGGDGRYLLMASPVEVRRALTWRFPQLEQAYLGSRSAASPDGAAPEIDQIVMMYPQEIFRAFGDREEQDVKEDVSPVMLRRFSIEPSAESIESPERPSLLRWEILRCDTLFVALLEEGRLVRVIDRVQMASKIAIREFEEHVG